MKVSEPPQDFPVPFAQEMYTDKNVFVLRQEVERLTYETKKQFEELQ